MLKFRIFWVSLALLAVVADQLSKTYVVGHLIYAEPHPLIPGLNLTLSYNPGIAFGWLNSGGAGIQIFLLSMTCLIILGLGIWLLRTPRSMPLQGLALTLIIGGALGNLIDRFGRGYVVDFIDFYIGSWHWHIFNFADSFITIGAGLLILSTFFQKKDEADI